MKRVIFGVVAASFACAAMAQRSYSEAAELQRRCRTYGEMAREVKISNTIGGKPLQYYSQEHEAGRITQPVLMEIVMTFISISSDDTLRTPDDAYMKGWAACMDKK